MWGFYKDPYSTTYLFMEFWPGFHATTHGPSTWTPWSLSLHGRLQGKVDEARNVVEQFSSEMEHKKVRCTRENVGVEGLGQFLGHLKFLWVWKRCNWCEQKYRNKREKSA